MIKSPAAAIFGSVVPGGLAGLSCRAVQSGSRRGTNFSFKLADAPVHLLTADLPTDALKARACAP